MSLNSEHHLRCFGCSFRVHDRYFTDKLRFVPGVCPNCGGQVHVVDPFTDDRSRTHMLDIAEGSRTYRRVIPIESEVAA